MVEIFDFRKYGGEKISNVIDYVRDYYLTHDNIDVMVATDSQSKGSKTKFCTVIAMYDRGDGEHGHGAHCISSKWNVPRYKKEQRAERLLKEVEESINIAKSLRENGVKIKYVDIDINPNPGQKQKNKSNEVFDAARGWVEGEGFECRWKTLGALFTTYADWEVKRK
ncbi:MAG: hypothetical protein IJH39_04415 [Clostridia bacterium]|nr:hypothetical protein [Clostridia bacterium]